MGSVWRNVSEEWYVGVRLLFHPSDCRFEKDIRTKTFSLNYRVIVENYIVEVPILLIRRKIRADDEAGRCGAHVGIQGRRHQSVRTDEAAARRDRPRRACALPSKTRYFGLAVKWTETVSRQAYAVRPPVYSIVYDEN